MPEPGPNPHVPARSGPDVPRGPRHSPLTALGHLSLAHKLTVMLMITSVGALVLAGVAISLREIDSSRVALERDLTSLGDVVATNAAAALSFGDEDAARGVLASLAARRDIARAALVLPDGQVFAAYEAHGERPLRSIERSLTPAPVVIRGRLTIVRPVEVRGEKLGSLYLECTMSALQARVRDVVLSVVALMLVAALFAYAISLRLHRVVSEPVSRLSQAAHRVSASRDYSVRVEWPNRDELGLLTDAFNDMMEQVQAKEAQLVASHERLRQAQKMEAVGQLAGGVAHDFNNLLTAINGYASLLERRLEESDPRIGHVREIRKAGDRAAGLVRQLLAFGRKQTLEPRVLDLRETLADLEGMLGRLIPEHTHLVWDTARRVASVKADPGQIQQAVVNLVVNARDAMPKGGTITIGLADIVLGATNLDRVPGATPGPWVVLSVADTGAGIPEAIRAHIFEPFFTTKDVGQGTGLGLATVYGIVEQSGGRVTFDSAEGRGTTFLVWLPAVPGTPRARPSGAAATSPGGHETILLVEDEPAVRELTRDILVGYGYRVIECDGPEAALRASEAHDGRIDAMLTDFVMPGLNGRELSLKLAVTRPEMRTIFMSGYTDGVAPAQGPSGRPAVFVSKPFVPDALATTVRAALDGEPAA